MNWIEDLTSNTPPNAVFLSYVHNDAIAIYGERSVLNYRHIVPFDRKSNSYQYDMIENLLVSEIELLFKKNKPVYYILDKDPSLYNSYEILDEHFKMTLLNQQYQLYTVTRD